MDIEPSTATKESESNIEPLSTSSQDTILLSPVAATPKNNGKTSKARGSSESPQTPIANKIAKLTPRATRSSQNPEFAAKQRKFLNRVHDPIRNNSDSDNSQESPVKMKGTKENKQRSAERKTGMLSDSKKKSDKESTPKRHIDSDEEEGPGTKKRKMKEPTKVVGGKDSYCWKCHRDGEVIRCECAPCPRVYHVKCMHLDKPPDHPWMCPECSLITQAEDTDTRSRAMQMLSLEQLCNLLRFALNRMKNHEGAEDFAKPVDLVEFPYYLDYIIKPMDLSQLERNIKARQYGSTQAFLADAKWIVHNSIIFNSVQSKFTNTARALLKLCRQEMQHIENCPDCYLNSHTRSSDSWFTEACRRPHILVWAKLKGFPFWPAKVMSFNSENNQVDVRFFGAHDRAWIPLSQCYLYSKLSPTPATNNKNKRSLEECLQELEYHIKRLRDKFGHFEYAPYKTPYDPNNEDQQLLMMLPQYESKNVGKRSRLSLHHDGARKSLGRRTILPKRPSHEKPKSEEIISPKTPSPEKPMSEETISPKNLSPEELMSEETIPPSPEEAMSEESISPSPEESMLEETVSPINPSPDIPMLEETISPKNPSPGIPMLEETISPKNPSPEEPMSEEIPVNPTTLNVVSGTESTEKEGDGPMVVISKKAKGSAQSDSEVTTPNRALPPNHEESEAEQIAVKKVNGTPVLKKKTPLTAAAKKCFATDKICAKCNTRTTTVNEENLCSICSKVMDKSSKHFKKDKCSSDPSSTVRGTVTVQRIQAMGAESDQPGEETTELDTCQSETDQRIAETEVSSSMEDPLATDLVPVESPPNFVIHKGVDNDSPEPLNKASIVDRLQEKLCFTVIEALKDQMTPEEVQAIEQAKEIDSSPEKVTGDTTAQESAEPVVLLHDLKNNKDVMDKLRENDANKTVEKNKINVETHSPSEGGSEFETDVSSCGDSDSVAGQQSRKRRNKNINNVVETLNERKNSVDGPSECKKANTEQSKTVMLDDSIGVSPILIIDEGESSDSKKSNSGKNDKNRRKGIPAKVHSRSSTSTESSEAENRLTKSRSIEVLDEASGHFRRLSSENDRPVTITVVTDDDKPQKKAGKEIRSVNISKSLSLSVIKDSGGLEMECAESDVDDQIIVDSVRRVPPRPTARKTMPNAPPPRGPASVDTRPSSVPLAASQPTPPPLVSLRQAKPFAPVRTPLSPPPQSKNVRKPSLRAEVGPAHARLEEVVNKTMMYMRSTCEDWLKEASEGSSNNVGALKQAHQLEIERLRWQHKQEMAELKHNTDLVMSEMRASMEADKQRALLDFKHKVEIEKEQAIQEVKKHQWCAFCQKEAQLYCCWNTSYCSFVCQQDHWGSHMNNCRNRLQAPGEEGHRSASVPAFPQVGYNS